MPVYEYRCAKCGPFEIQLKVTEDSSSDILCAHCNGPASRVYTTPAIHFRGHGFYNTDYKRKKEHGAKEEKPPQEVKKDADQSSASNKPA